MPQATSTICPHPEGLFFGKVLRHVPEVRPKSKSVPLFAFSSYSPSLYSIFPSLPLSLCFFFLFLFHALSLSFFLSLTFSFYFSLSLSFFFSLSLWLCLLLSFSFYLSIFLFFYHSLSLWFYLSLSLWFYLSLSLWFCLSLSLWFYLSLSLWFYLSLISLVLSFSISLLSVSIQPKTVVPN